MQSEFDDSMKLISSKLAPVLSKVERTLNKQVEGDDAVVTKFGMSFLEMKYNLFQAYAINLGFYILLKLEGK
jgi:U3 small nucleolar ribonucleoprotein protein LCP5